MIVNFQPEQYFSLTQTSQQYFFTNQPNEQAVNGDKSATPRLRSIGHALATHVVKPNPSCMVAEL